MSGIKEHQEKFLAAIIAAGMPASPVGPAPADPVIGQQLVAAKAAVAEAKAGERAAVEEAKAARAALVEARVGEKAALGRVAELEAELASAKEAEKAAKEEAKVATAALVEAGEMGSVAKSLVSFIEDEEGKVFLAAFAAGGDDFIDKVASLVRPHIEDLVNEVPIDLVDPFGRMAELVGEILFDGLKKRKNQQQQPEPDPVVIPNVAASPNRPIPRRGKGSESRYKRVNQDFQEFVELMNSASGIKP